MKYETDKNFWIFADKLKMCDVEYVHPIKEHSWGQRVVRIYDPDKHIIEVGENMKVVCKRFLDSGMTPEQVAERMDVPMKFVNACMRSISVCRSNKFQYVEQLEKLNLTNPGEAEMNRIKLVFPTIAMEKDALEFKMKFYNNGEKTISGSYKLDVDKYSYLEWLEIIQNNTSVDTANPRFGVSDTLFAMNEENEIVGIINIRYDMTEFYKDSGHIGYSVVPEKRRQGYATEMLKEALKRVKMHKLSEVKIVCSADNIPSRKTIIACGGKLNRMIKCEGADKEEYVIML